MSYPSASQGSEIIPDTGLGPFEVPVEVVLHGLRFLAREPQCLPLQTLLEKDITDVEQLLSLVAELESQTLSVRVSGEIDLIIDDYRRSVAMV